MIEPSQIPPVGSGDLRRELHRFLSLEAPFLIPALPAGDSDEEAEAALLAEIAGRLRSDGGLAEGEIYPSVTAGRAVGWYRRELEADAADHAADPGG
jgi:hypothetical protein